MNTDLSKIKNVLNAQLQRHNVIANNLANSNTVGFKRDTIFMKVLKGQESKEFKAVTNTDYTQGTLKQTNNTFDIAISGRGFFTVEQGDGEAYSRNGHFTVDEYGILRTSSGSAVLGLAGVINVAVDGRNSAHININTNGAIFANEELIDRLKIVDFESSSELKKIGDNKFIAQENANAFEVDEPNIKQGFLEESNVNTVKEMIGLMDLQRQFESAQKVIRTIDQTLNQTANKISDYR